jgi:hypothetical protein
MPAILLGVALLDPAEYARVAVLVPHVYGGIIAGLMRADQVVTLSVGLLSLLAAVQRTRGRRHALRWTAAASYAFLLVPSLIGLVPFGYWFLAVRKREREAAGQRVRSE